MDEFSSISRRTFLAGVVGVSATGMGGCLVEPPDRGINGSIIRPGGGPEYNPEEVPVNPDTVQIDQPFSIQFDGLSSVDTVELTVSITDPKLVEWTTQLSYDVEGGTLNLDRDEPADAGFGTGTMRKIQMAKPESREYSYPLRPEDEVTFAIEVDGEQVAVKTVTRTMGHPEVYGTPVRDSNTVAGRVFEPPGEQSAPGVIFLHGSAGNISEQLAGVLASNGFVVLGLKYFAPEAGKPLVEVPVERVERGAEWLLDHERVEGSQVGAIGYSAGAELALLAGSQFDALGAVVSINGSGVVWAGITSEGNIAQSSMWARDGAPVPYIPLDWEGDVSQREAHEESFEEATATTIQDATIPVENIDGPVLLISGRNDQRWNTAQYQGIAYDRLQEYDHPPDAKHLIYQDAGHLISYPYYPTAYRDLSTKLQFGGNRRGHAKSDAHHWPRVLDTLNAVAVD